MAQKPLLQMLEELATKVRSLEREKSKVDARMEELQREKAQDGATIEALKRAERQASATIEALERAEGQAALKIEELEHDKKQAALAIQGLERELGELSATIAQAGEKVDEMLKEGKTADTSPPGPVTAAAESKSFEQSGQSSADAERDMKWRSSKAFRFD